MKTRNAIAWGVVAALAVGGIAWADRERRVQDCRRVAAHAVGGFESYGDPQIDGALELAVTRNRERARQCYERGLLETPWG